MKHHTYQLQNPVRNNETMMLTEIKKNLRILSRSAKFSLIQFLATELAQEEQELSKYFPQDSQHGFWSQHNAFEAAQKLEALNIYSKKEVNHASSRTSE